MKSGFEGGQVSHSLVKISNLKLGYCQRLNFCLFLVAFSIEEHSVFSPFLPLADGFLELGLFKTVFMIPQHIYINNFRLNVLLCLASWKFSGWLGGQLAGLF